MITATLTLNPKFKIDKVDDRVFGGFIEHLGQCVYGGVYDPGHDLADNDGLRSDVQEALRDLEISVVRYPGGNFVSGYHWQDGIGPQSQRPTVRDLAWNSLESNQFGTDEFINLCSKMNWIPMLAVNLGTGSPEEARNWVEYCNSPVGSKFANLRLQNGREQPYSVPLWCLGNEMDGPWQLGHVDVTEYASRARQAAKLMLDCDPTIETVLCGSSSPGMNTFLEWDRVAMEQVGSLAHYISLHRYVGNADNDSENYLALSNSIDSQIEAVAAAARYVQVRRRIPRPISLCIDEWNVWYRNRPDTTGDAESAKRQLYEFYNLEDALVVGMFFNSFIRHPNTVKIANIAQLVNVIAPILTNETSILRQSIYYAFKMFSSRKGGVALRQHLDCPGYESASHGSVKYVDSSVIHDGRTLKVFVINRNLHDSVRLNLRLHDASIQDVMDADILHHEDLRSENTFQNPNSVIAREFDGWKAKSREGMSAEIPPQSLLATTFSLVQ